MVDVIKALGIEYVASWPAELRRTPRIPDNYETIPAEMLTTVMKNPP